MSERDLTAIVAGFILCAAAVAVALTEDDKPDTGELPGEVGDGQ